MDKNCFEISNFFLLQNQYSLKSLCKNQNLFQPIFKKLIILCRSLRWYNISPIGPAVAAPTPTSAQTGTRPRTPLGRTAPVAYLTSSFIKIL